MSFDPQFLDALRDAVSLAEVVGRKVKLVRRGREYTGLCPFHNEKTPSFTVSEDKQFFHCFGCGAHGDAIGFVMQTEGLSFPEAVEKLAGPAGLELPERRPADRAAEKRRANLHDALEQACRWFEEQLAQAAGREARAYVTGRGLEPATISAFRLGYAPDSRGALRRALNARGIDDALLVEAGLIKAAEGGGEPRDYFFNRLIFPITDRRGRVIAFGGRALSSEAKAKYLNSPDGPLFHKGRVLYNLHRARQAAHDGGELIVAEGYMDVIALSQAGFPAAVAPLGTAVTEEQIGETWRLAAEPILCLDGDNAGQRAAFRAAERALALLRPGRSLRFALLPVGEDPDSLLRTAGAGALRTVLDGARPLVDLLWDGTRAEHRLDTPERKAALREALFALAGRIQDRSVQDAYRTELLRRYDELVRPRRQARNNGRFARRPGGAGADSFRAGGERREVGLGLQRPPTALLRRRPEQILLALALSYPQLASDHIEVLAEVPLTAPEHERLRRALLDLIGQGTDLDREQVRCQLSAEGYSGLLDAILGPSVYLHEPLARGDAPAAEARKRFGYWISRVREGAGRADVVEAVRRLAEDTNDVHLDRVQAERALAEESTAQQRVIERYETADPKE